MQAIGRQPERAPEGAPVHDGRRRPEQTTPYRLVQQHAATFIAEAEAAAGAFLCSVQGGYITGQNWLLDGGGYPGTFQGPTRRAATRPDRAWTPASRAARQRQGR